MSDQSLRDPKQDQRVEIPAQYAVLLLNDDYSTWDFVIEVLVRIFHKSTEQAEIITSRVHHEGEGVCGLYSFEIGQTKVAQVHQLAKQRGYPLKAILREA